MGLRVEPYEEALQFLEKCNYTLISDNNGVQVLVDRNHSVQSLLQAFGRQGITAVLSDLAGHIYQG
jgi:hypothetical protein